MAWQTKKLEIIMDFFKNNTSSIIWIIFSILFLYMAWREWQKSKKPLDSLKSSFFKNPNSGVQIKIKMAGIDFESFVNELEKSNQGSHLIAATSYLMAGLTAVASFIFSLIF